MATSSKPAANARLPGCSASTYRRSWSTKWPGIRKVSRWKVNRAKGREPKQLSKLMNEFLTPLTEVIYKHRGTIDKYMGDCIMAFWGAPLLDPAHARNAIMAGLEMHQTMRS